MHNKITVLNRNIINEFIENIYVDENKNVTIEFKYQDEYNQLLNYINDKKMWYNRRVRMGWEWIKNL